MSETRTSSRFQFRLRTLFAVTALVAVPLAGYVVWDRAMDRFFHDLLVGETGPVTKREDWPRPLLDTIAELDEADLDVSTIQVHCLCRALDLEYVWRMDGNAILFKLLKDQWQLTQVSNPERFILENGRSRISGIAPPAWWSPKNDGLTAFYVCPQELAKEKGDRFQVAFDPRREIMYVHYWFNF